MLDPEYKKKDGSKLDKEEKEWIKQQIRLRERQIIAIEKEHRYDLASEQEKRKAQRERQEKEEEAERERQSKIPMMTPEEKLKYSTGAEYVEQIHPEGWNTADSMEEEIVKEAASRSDSLHKELLGAVEFMGDRIKVFTVNGQYTRSPYGPDIIEFTMGGNWYGGSREGTYRLICAEDEVVLHELMPPVDILATLVHEVVERWGMKTKGLSYDDAHSDLAEPAERKARRILEGGDWSFEGSLGDQFQRLIDRIAA
jgi:hypothetical protein